MTEKDKKQNKQETRRIEFGTFWLFLQEFEKAVKDGFTLSEKNEYFPQNYQGFFYCVMVKGGEPETVQVQQPKQLVETVQEQSAPETLVEVKESEEKELKDEVQVQQEKVVEKDESEVKKDKPKDRPKAK